MGWRTSSGKAARTLGAALVTVALIAPGAALAEVTREGDWSDEDPEVSLDVDAMPRNEAIKRVAEAAGWSVVLRATQNDPVDVHVRDQPAGRVLDLLLADGHYVARRTGDLLLISPADAVTRAIPAPDPPRPPPRAASREHRRRGTDRVVTGGSLRVEKDEVVNDVTVMGGNVDVWGTVTGDLTVMGGAVHIHDDGRVRGDAVAVGGTLTVEDGARVDGDVGVLGGVLERSPGARIGGDVREHAGHTGRRGRGGAPQAVEPERTRSSGTAGRLARDAGSAITRSALLFVYGTVLLALATERMEQIRLQIASRPMRSFATGIVASIVAMVVFIALCVTVIGIPFAIFLALGVFMGVAAAMCAVLETAGAAVLGHRTKNPYVHLAIGCAAFLVLGAIPFVGAVVKAVVVLTAIGSLVATRGAGLFPTKNRVAGSPYRDPQTA